MVQPTPHPSPNYGTNRLTTDFVIIHGTWMENDADALARLCDPATEVSCHYYIDYAGNLLQLVDEAHVAWHAGVSRWGQLEKLNLHSIGIEIANPGIGKNTPYTEAQYETLLALLADVCERHKISPQHVLGHEDIAPNRKDDPGPHFNWQRLRAAGLVSGVRAPYSK
jgi:N-acetylmuramoyl-L-alanine amidase